MVCSARASINPFWALRFSVLASTSTSFARNGNKRVRAAISSVSVTPRSGTGYRASMPSRRNHPTPLTQTDLLAPPPKCSTAHGAAFSVRRNLGIRFLCPLCPLYVRYAPSEHSHLRTSRPVERTSVPPQCPNFSPTTSTIWASTSALCADNSGLFVLDM